jgi:hypothetical protein
MIKMGSFAALRISAAGFRFAHARKAPRIDIFKMGSFAALRISAAGFRFAHARKAPQLADSGFSLYTTSFPIHSGFCLRLIRRAAVAARDLGKDSLRCKD